jgi:hypothetical protein
VLQFRFGDGGFDMKVLELKPAKRVLWQVVDGPEEWLGTKISFDLKQNGDWTVVLFKHEGLEGARGIHAPLQHQVGGLPAEPQVPPRNRQRRAVAKRDQARHLGIAGARRLRPPASNVTERTMKDIMRDELEAPKIVDRSTFQAELDALRVREKAHTREGDAIAAARRGLPMIEVNGATPLIGERGKVTLLDAFEGQRMLIAYYFMWHTGHPAPEQCEGCTFYTSQVRELSFLHSRDVTYATFCQGPYEESARYRDFMGWEMPWYSAPRDSLDTLLVGRRVGMMHIVCTCDEDPMSSRLTGRPGAASRLWITAIGCST